MHNAMRCSNCINSKSSKENCRHFTENARKHPKFGKCLHCKSNFKKDRPSHTFCSRRCYWISSLLSKKSKITQIARVKNKTHNLWKHGLTPLNKRLRRGAEFKKWRKSVFEYDSYTCWICGIQGGLLHPHHLFRWSEHPGLRFVLSNGVTLCEFCHKTYTKYGNKKDDSQIQELIIRKSIDRVNPRVELMIC